jgi:hypothetical protein
MLSGERWRKISWRRGTKGRLTCLFAARRVRIAEGHKHRMQGNRMQCMPGDEVWLVGERRSTGEQKYYVSNLPADATLKMLAAAIKAVLDPGHVLAPGRYCLPPADPLRAVAGPESSRCCGSDAADQGIEMSHPGPL